MRILWSTVSNTAGRSSEPRSVTSPGQPPTEHLIPFSVLQFPSSGAFYRQTAGSVEDHAAPNMQQVDDRPVFPLPLT